MKKEQLREPLHGISVMIKDKHEDQMVTTAGSLTLVGSNVQTDAFIAEKLRVSGDVLSML